MQLQEENLEVSTAIAALETELTSESDNHNTTVSDIADFTFQSLEENTLLQFESFTMVCYLIRFLHPRLLQSLRWLLNVSTLP